jgi:haloalkane dehalogenase
MEVLRTPEARFSDLSGFPFEPHFCESPSRFSGLRMHWVDEGPADAEHVFLCLHGQPTWSYLYRRMIPVFVRAGNRVLAPDLFGFGRSDKPVDDSVYSFDFHRNCLIDFIEMLDLERITLVCQDWGGLLGLTIPMDMPHRFERVLLMNTALGTGDVPLTEGFIAWRTWSNAHPDMAVGRLLKRTCPHISNLRRLPTMLRFPTCDSRPGSGGSPTWCRIGPTRPVPTCRGAHGIGGETRGAAAASRQSAPPIGYWASPSCWACGK